MHFVYRLQPHEYSKYQHHLLKLDPESKFMRFGYHITDDAIIQLCAGFQSKSTQHKLFVIENDDLEVVAVGHISLEGDETELAFSVLKEHQNKGMGSALMKRCIEWCQNRGIKAGCMVCLTHNTAIKHLATQHGILITEGGETLADIKIPEASAASVMHEVMDSNLAQFDHLGKIQRRFAKMLTFPLRFVK